ncbi:hypothetical protein DdX_09968 [Ditylenchus destructor]|uniref:Uncharacterized protein n=1 Tax=Ditylenchus destructor TaxID=166010 RepID=A0AAD4R2S3_9BILA|nr:hypothetical protein DdX_09968 [Ditylenchus destructor]
MPQNTAFREASVVPQNTAFLYAKREQSVVPQNTAFLYAKREQSVVPQNTAFHGASPVPQNTVIRATVARDTTNNKHLHNKQ